MEFDEVQTQADFVEFVSTLRTQLATGDEIWENSDLPGFLEAMQAWVSDSGFAVISNPWRHVADVMAAARVYE